MGELVGYEELIGFCYEVCLNCTYLQCVCLLHDVSLWRSFILIDCNTAVVWKSSWMKLMFVSPIYPPLLRVLGPVMFHFNIVIEF